MMIGEAIQFISKRQILGCFLTCDECDNYGCYVYKIIEMLKELQWWRSQDLIPRDMALDIYYNCPQAYDCDISSCDGCAIKRINQIPKAEYRGDDNGNR